MAAWAVSLQGCLQNRETSPAKIATSAPFGSTVFRLLIYSRKNTSCSSSTDPCGRSNLSGIGRSCSPLIFTLACRFKRKSHRHLAKVRGRPSSTVLNRRFSFQTRFNAFVKSRRIRTVRLSFVAWKPSLIVCVTHRIGSSQERVVLKPACSGQSQPRVSAK